MYTVVLTTCKDHQVIWSGVPAFAASVSELENKLAEFTQIAEKRLYDTSNITKAKTQLMDSLHEKVYGVVRIIEAYALKEGLDSLAREYNISKTSLVEGGAKITVNRFNNVVKKATELAADLEALGLTPQFLQELTLQVDEAKEVISKPRLAIIQRRLQSRKLEQLLDEMQEIVYKHLSAMLRILQFDHPMFFAEFMDARNIIDRKGRRRGSTPDPAGESPPLAEGPPGDDFS